MAVGMNGCLGWEGLRLGVVLVRMVCSLEKLDGNGGLVVRMNW
jgi:hypothetical protein